MARADEANAQFALLKKALERSKKDQYLDVFYEILSNEEAMGIGILTSIEWEIEDAGYGEVDKSRSETLSFLNSISRVRVPLMNAFDNVSENALQTLKGMDAENLDSNTKIENETKKLADKLWKSEGGMAQLDRLIKHFEKFLKVLNSQNKSKKRFLKMKKLLGNSKFLKGHYSKFANDDAIKDFKKATDRLKEIKAQKLPQKTLAEEFSRDFVAWRENTKNEGTDNFSDIDSYNNYSDSNEYSEYYDSQ